jgi:FkbM family methyltransferase
MGQQAIAVRLLGDHLYTPQTFVRQTLVGGGILDLDLSNWTERYVYLTRRYEPDIVSLIERRLPKGGVFFDVGANIGLISFSIGGRRADALIRAFEPVPETGQRWLRNRELNPDVHAVLEVVAVGAQDGSVSIARPVDQSGIGWVPGGADEALPHSLMEVPVVALDRYAAHHGFERIDVLKLDVEGYEQFALQGCSRLLEQRRIGCIICELNDPLLERHGTTRQELIAWLESRGYNPLQIPRTGARRLRRVSQAADIAFVPLSGSG